MLSDRRVRVGFAVLLELDASRDHYSEIWNQIKINVENRIFSKEYLTEVRHKTPRSVVTSMVLEHCKAEFDQALSESEFDTRYEIARWLLKSSPHQINESEMNKYLFEIASLDPHNSLTITNR